VYPALRPSGPRARTRRAVRDGFLLKIEWVTERVLWAGAGTLAGYMTQSPLPRTKNIRSLRHWHLVSSGLLEHHAEVGVRRTRLYLRAGSLRAPCRAAMGLASTRRWLVLVVLDGAKEPDIEGQV